MIEPTRPLGVVIEGGQDVGPASALWSGGIDAAAFKDAEHECVHGRLPGDRTRPCGCWPQEPEREELPVASATAEAPHGVKQDGTPRQKPGPRPGAKRARKPAFTPAEARALSFPERILRDFDEEIARLTAARAAVAEAVDGASARS